MLPLNFGVLDLVEIAVLVFASTPLRVTFSDDATVRGEGRLMSLILISILLPLQNGQLDWFLCWL